MFTKGKGVKSDLNKHCINFGRPFNDKSDKNENKLTRPTVKQVRSTIKVLEDVSIFSKFGEELMASLEDLN